MLYLLIKDYNIDKLYYKCRCILCYNFHLLIIFKDGLPAIITFTNAHNHTLISGEALSFLRPTDDIRCMFNGYFTSGLGKYLKFKNSIIPILCTLHRYYYLSQVQSEIIILQWGDFISYLYTPM